MHDLGHPYRGQVAITLIGVDELFWQNAFYAGCHSRCSSVRRFLKIKCKIVIHQYGTSYRSDTDCPITDAQFVDDLCNEPMGYAMGASGTIVSNLIR